MYNGPIRGGSRGGRDQFNWESVKGDKDREFYIGHSVKASVGRWQKGKDILWYTREKSKNGNALEEERAAVRNKEEDLMLEALGLKKKVREGSGSFPAPRLERYELDEMLRRGNGEEGSGGAGVGLDAENGETVKGLGFKPGNFGGVAVRELLAGVDNLKDGNFPLKTNSGGMVPQPSGKSTPVDKDIKTGVFAKDSKMRKKEKKSKKPKDKDTRKKKTALSCSPQEKYKPSEKTRAKTSTDMDSKMDDRTGTRSSCYRFNETRATRDIYRAEKPQQDQHEREEEFGEFRKKEDRAGHRHEQPASGRGDMAYRPKRCRRSQSSDDSWEKLDERHRKRGTRESLMKNSSRD